MKQFKKAREERREDMKEIFTLKRREKTKNGRRVVQRKVTKLKGGRKENQ